MQIAGIILAGGEGRRLGGADKALLPLAGRPLLSHGIDRLAPQVGVLAVSANGDPSRLIGFGLPVLPDEAAMGPLSGILAGLRWASGAGAGALVSVPVDTPFLPADLVNRLCDGGTDVPVMAESGRLHPAIACWPVTLAAPLAGFLTSGAKARVLDFALAHGARRVAFPDPRAFDNLNTPEDLALAEARLGAT